MRGFKLCEFCLTVMPIGQMLCHECGQATSAYHKRQESRLDKVSANVLTELADRVRLYAPRTVEELNQALAPMENHDAAR